MVTRPVYSMHLGQLVRSSLAPKWRYKKNESVDANQDKQKKGEEKSGTRNVKLEDLTT